MSLSYAERSLKPAEHADIVFVYTPGGKSGAPFQKSLGASYIRAYLLSHGIGSIQFCASTPLNVHSCVQKILECKPKIVGFTVFFSNYAVSALIARELKKSAGNITIIFGGPHATVLPEEILSDSDFADICVCGPGEEVMLEIVKSLLTTKGKWRDPDPDLLSTVKGIYYRAGNHMRSTGKNAFPPPGNRSEAGLDRYPSPYLSKVLSADDASNAGIITSRGCNQNCTYCNCAVLSGGKVLFHSVDRVLSELMVISHGRSGGGIVPIMDDAFTLYPRRAEKIFQGILSQGIRLPLAITTRADYLSEDLLLLMKAGGLTAIGFSLESAVPEILRNIGKVQSPVASEDSHYAKEKRFIDCVVRYSAFARDIGIPVISISTMVGLPGEDLGQAQKTLDFIKKLSFTHHHHNIVNILPGTPLAENYKQHGYRVKPYRHGRIMPLFERPFPVSTTLKKDSRTRKVETAIRKDMAAANALSLLSSGKEKQSFFLRVFLFSERLNEEIINWLTQNLAINGAVYQIFANPGVFRENRDPSRELLHRSWCSSLNYRAYVFEKNISRGGDQVLMSGRLLSTEDENDGMKIIFSRSGLSFEKKEERNVSYSKNGDIGLKTILGKKILGAASDHSPDKRPGIRTRKGRPWTQTGTI